MSLKRAQSKFLTRALTQVLHVKDTEEEKKKAQVPTGDIPDDDLLRYEGNLSPNLRI
jgi:hypothetical protein